jgi:hypothetical protein
VLYALTNPQHTPWETPSKVLFNDVPCKFCYKSVCPEGHHQCLRGVPPDRVVAAAQSFLSVRTWSQAAMAAFPSPTPTAGLSGASEGIP